MRLAAEFAAGTDDAVGIGQAAAVIGRVTFQHLDDTAGIAITAEGHGLGRLDPDLVLMEQPP